MRAAEEEQLKRTQLGLAQSSAYLRAGCALLALPFILAALAVFVFLFYVVARAVFSGS